MDFERFEHMSRIHIDLSIQGILESYVCFYHQPYRSVASFTTLKNECDSSQTSLILGRRSQDGGAEACESCLNRSSRS